MDEEKPKEKQIKEESTQQSEADEVVNEVKKEETSTEPIVNNVEDNSQTKNIQDDPDDDEDDDVEEEKITISKTSMTKAFKGIGIAVIIIALIAGLSFMGYKMSDPKTETPGMYEFNGFAFLEKGPYTKTQIQFGDNLFTIPLRFGPYDLENVTSKGNSSTFASETAKESKVILLLDDWGTRNGNLSMAVNEISKNADRVLFIQTYAACTENTTTCANMNLSILNCDDAEIPTVYFVNKGEPKISFDNKCVTLSGEGDGIVKAADRLLLNWFGIMES